MYKKSCTFVLGLSKEVLSPINLLVISFSVINYVVRVRVHAGCVDAHFLYSPLPSSTGKQFRWTNWARPDSHPRKRQFWWTNRGFTRGTVPWACRHTCPTAGLFVNLPVEIFDNYGRDWNKRPSGGNRDGGFDREPHRERKCQGVRDTYDDRTYGTNQPHECQALSGGWAGNGRD